MRTHCDIFINLCSATVLSPRVHQILFFKITSRKDTKDVQNCFEQPLSVSGERGRILSGISGTVPLTLTTSSNVSILILSSYGEWSPAEIRIYSQLGDSCCT